MNDTIINNEYYNIIMINNNILLLDIIKKTKDKNKINEFHNLILSFCNKQNINLIFNISKIKFNIKNIIDEKKFFMNLPKKNINAFAIIIKSKILKIIITPFLKKNNIPTKIFNNLEKAKDFIKLINNI